MTDLTTATDFDLIDAQHKDRGDVTDAITIDRWTNYGKDRLYLNGLKTGDGWISLKTNDAGGDRWTKVDARRSIDGDELTIEVYKGPTVYYTLTVRVHGDAFAAEEGEEQADGDDTAAELVTDGGTTLTDDDWARVQDDLNLHLDDLIYHYGDPDTDDQRIVYEDRHTIILADGSGYDLNEIADQADVDRSTLAERMHERARDLTDYDWSVVDPVVIELTDAVSMGVRVALKRIAQRTQETGSVSRAVDQYAVRVRGYSQRGWAQASGRDESTVSRTVNPR